ncbi:D-2-hydroxyacid dehydrogenase [Vibrio viridaestus]|uniref:D-2-hydroxyacid dehydrogenase n=1 Tax=Vibrio viridaestus TaxID=2487322 RepID=A0A3N9TCA6_9VIBR|nr:D-2-hydroxyacid dehydrogenase [Vibrio viridaestus]RQW61699.1 D-2-hydroxyacid dehydrogenase [Vibrio viridaestus]
MNNSPHSVYLLTTDNEKYLALLDEAIQQNRLQITSDKNKATVLLADPPIACQCLEDFPQLEWMQSTYAGIDSLIKPHLRHDYFLTNIKGPFGQLITEYVLGYTLSHLRHFPTYAQQQTSHQWLPHSYQSIVGKHVVTFGTGTIAAEIAEKLSALGMCVSGVNTRGIPPKNSPFSQVFHINEAGAALSHADIIVNTLPHTENTYHIFDDELLSSCENALLFNVGRGSAINTDSLLNALDTGRIEHAYLDVFEQEPLPEDHPYWSHPSITVTPHIAAVSFPEQIVDIFLDNLDLWQEDEPLNFLIDFDKGY